MLFTVTRSPLSELQQNRDVLRALSSIQANTEGVGCMNQGGKCRLGGP
jgi:hypothetical protein